MTLLQGLDGPLGSSSKNRDAVILVLETSKSDSLTVLALCWVGAGLMLAPYLHGACIMLV
jgi:hypothetical protein